MLYALTSFEVLPVGPDTKSMSLINPFCYGIEQQQELQLLPKSLLFALEIA